MPHITVEYSANLEPLVDVPAMLGAVHQAAVSSGVFELAAIRTRGEPRAGYVIADGDPRHVFVAVSARIAPGRPAEARKALSQAMLDAVDRATAALQAERGVALSTEVLEIDNTAALRKNNLHQRLKKVPA